MRVSFWALFCVFVVLFDVWESYAILAKKQSLFSTLFSIQDQVCLLPNLEAPGCFLEFSLCPCCCRGVAWGSWGVVKLRTYHRGTESLILSVHFDPVVQKTA